MGGYNFQMAVSMLTDGMATKRPSWGGYVKRVDTTGGAYQLVFVKRNGTDTYTYNVSSAGVVTTTDSMVLDADLMAGMMATDWTVDKTTAYESARGGTGAW